MRKPIGITVPYREVGYKEKPTEKRAWIGLTHFERVSIIEEDRNRSLLEHCERIEAKLKERNT